MGGGGEECGERFKLGEGLGVSGKDSCVSFRTLKVRLGCRE